METGGVPLTDAAVLFVPFGFGDAVVRTLEATFALVFALGLGDMRVICGDETLVLRLALFGEDGIESIRARGVVGGLKLDGGGVVVEGDCGVLDSNMERGRAMLRVVPATEAVGFMFGLPILPTPLTVGIPLREKGAGEGDDGLCGVLTELDGWRDWMGAD